MLKLLLLCLCSRVAWDAPTGGFFFRELKAACRKLEAAKKHLNPEELDQHRQYVQKCERKETLQKHLGAARSADVTR